MDDIAVMRVRRQGEDLVIVLPAEVARQQELREGDAVLVLRAGERTAFEQALRDVLREHAGTFDYLRDK
jgi:antitoxin component of MazEF toxin-antitoxin module